MIISASIRRKPILLIQVEKALVEMCVLVVSGTNSQSSMCGRTVHQGKYGKQNFLDPPATTTTTPKTTEMPKRQYKDCPCCSSKTQPGTIHPSRLPLLPPKFSADTPARNLLQMECTKDSTIQLPHIESTVVLIRICQWETILATVQRQSLMSMP